jgi:hypothetical protein
METDDPGSFGEPDILDFVSSITDTARLRIEERLPHGFVRLKVAEAERRQAQHDIRSVEDIVRELVRNARDAGARNVFVASQKEKGRYRRLTVIDDGSGIPGDMHDLIFEPRVTSKSEDFEEDRYGVHGRGMALFSIRSRVSDARIVSSIPERGTAVSLTVDTSKVPERSDQTTIPRLERSDGKEDVGGGPHNVPRVLLEMSVDSPGIDFYLGSFADILATLRRLSSQEGEVAKGSIWSGIINLDDARELARSSAEVLGLPISERNAYRVLKEEVAPLPPIYRQALPATGPPKARETRTLAATERIRVRNPLRRLRKRDLEDIRDETERVVGRILGRYYLRTAGPARVRKSHGKITVSFYVTEEGEDD